MFKYLEYQNQKQDKDYSINQMKINEYDLY